MFLAILIRTNYTGTEFINYTSPSKLTTYFIHEVEYPIKMRFINLLLHNNNIHKKYIPITTS